MSLDTSPTNTSPFPLLELPNELLLEIGKHLEAPEISSLMLTNHHFASLFQLSLIQAAHSFIPASSYYLNIVPKAAVLNWAICKNHCEMVKKLLDTRGTTLNANELLRYGWGEYQRPLAYAESPEMSQILLDRGASVAQAFEDTPLFHPIVSMRPSLVRFWLDKGVDIHATSKSLEQRYIFLPRRTALHQSVTDYNWDDIPTALQVTEELLKRGADVNQLDSHGDTPLQVAVRELVHRVSVEGTDLFPKPYEERMKKYSTFVTLLLQYGADWGIKNAAGETVFEYCVREKYDEVLKVLRAHTLL
jgi:ankyrin repeat protein